MSEKRQSSPEPAAPQGSTPGGTEPPLHPKCHLQLRDPPEGLKEQNYVKASTSLLWETTS